VVFVLVGFWHLVCAFCNYVRQGREYTSKAWHAIGWFPYGLKHIELHLMVVLIPFAIFYELGVSTSFRPLVDSMIPLNRVASFEHTTTLFMFWLFAVIVLFSDTTAFLPLPAEASFLFAGLAFALEWISLAHEAARTSGLESQCNLLLAYTSGLCAASAGFLALRPKTFLVDVLLCMGIILQGTWLFQISLFLYVEQFIPQGCHYRLDLPTGIDGPTLCEVEQARIRAVALINLAFNCHVIAVVVLSVLLFALVAKLQGHRRGGYDPLVVETDPEGLQMKPLPKLNSFDRR
jgi:hypothetical protein